MREGIYESILTQRLRQALASAANLHAVRGALARAESADRIARFVADEVRRLLADHVHGDDAVARQASLANELLRVLVERLGLADAEIIAPPEELLLAVHRGPEPPERPTTPVGVSTLLACPGKPDLGQELGREIATADRVDALVSFVTWSGFRRLRKALEAHGAAGRRLRLLTGTYTGATEAAAVRQIARLPGAEVRVSFDGRRNRLHAKAWLFHRDSGFSTVWVGSANLSQTALAGGLEWTMKASEADLRHVVELFRGAFDSLWADPEFEPIDPEDSQQVERLESALRAARGGGVSPEESPSLFFDLRPYPFQEEILDALREERDGLGRLRNLVVAATGTGKTLVAAFDYARQPGRPRLLFLAHREELLRQARTAFRHVLRDGSFGALLTGAEKPSDPGHLFATIQSFHRTDLPEALGREFWQHMIVDECHHAPADSYQDVLRRVRPAVLVGLTATPERNDGQSLLPDFDGAISAEIRLWHALEKQLVVPFEYYGLADETDFTGLEWKRGAYDAASMEALLTGDDRRAELIAEQFRRLRGDWRSARTLAFCAGVHHADFMARKFVQYGIPALSVHGGTSSQERRAAPQRLRSREANVLFTCDLYNEGIDLPFVDTLLFLRPTSSATVFLQQLGRGLRLDADKAGCLVLDFVGQHRREFRFDTVLTALTGAPRGRLVAEVTAGFPTLPSGCSLQLDKVARDRILDGLRQTIGGGARRLASELRQLGDAPLAAFLEATGRQAGEVYEAGGFTSLRRQAGLLAPADDGVEAKVNRRFRHLLHFDDVERIATLRKLDDADEATLLSLGYQLFHEASDCFRATEWLSRLTPELRRELGELADVLMAGAHPLSSAPVVAGWPLRLHRSYGRREILAGCGHWKPTGKPSSREGVLRLDDRRIELMFVTLDKSEGRFSPTTSYRDYAISRELFHWESQNSAAEDTPSGRRYVDQAQNEWTFLLFVRGTPSDAFVALGPVRYATHAGNRPMGVTWQLDHAIPAALFERFAALLAA